MKRRIALVALVALMGALTWANAQPSVAGLIPSPWDLLAHAGVFCVLAALLAFAVGRERLWLALAIAIAYAMFDELRQLDLPGRDASVLDFATDLAGIALGTLAVGARE